MTIHAFCLSVVRQARALGGEGDERDLVVYQDFDQARVLRRALDDYLQDPDALADWSNRWGASGDERRDPRQLTIEAARKAIGAARNHGLSPPEAAVALAAQPELAALYAAYEAQRQAEDALDFYALVAEAIRLLDSDPVLLAAYHRRFRYVFEDEAQDSTPAQDVLIRLLTDPARGGSGNLVRVGDSNQAIMTSFTYNDPRFFRGFCAAPGWGTAAPNGRHVAMQESSRSALPILAVANALAACAVNHEDPAVRGAFVGGPIEQATAGKPNPPAGRPPSWTVYRSKDDEQLGVLARVRAYMRDHPTHRTAILLFSNPAVNEYTARALSLELPLFTGTRQAGDTKPILTLLARALAFLALPAGDPMGPFLGVLDARMKALEEHWEDARAVRRYLKAEGDLEKLLYPPSGLPPARPTELAEADYAAIVLGARALRTLLDARHLPPTELLPAIANELLAHPEAPLIAARAAALIQPVLRGHTDLEGAPRRQVADPVTLLRREVPDPLDRLRLALQELAEQTTERREILAAPVEVNEPGPGQLEILTLHRAKGAEYDAVWLPGLGYYNSYRARTFFPWHLDQAEIWDQAAFLAEQSLAEQARPTGHSLELRTRAAQGLTVAERLRLLYVGVTRAERELHLSCYSQDGSDPALPQLQAMIAHCEKQPG
jgi:DNA helicase-2/ATP-dependent DNA helicase PcrA